LPVAVLDALAEEGGKLLLVEVPSGVDGLDECASFGQEGFFVVNNPDEAEEVKSPEKEVHALPLLDGAAKLDELAQIPEASVGDECLAGVLVVRQVVRERRGDL